MNRIDHQTWSAYRGEGGSRCHDLHTSHLVGFLDRSEVDMDTVGSVSVPLAQCLGDPVGDPEALAPLLLLWPLDTLKHTEKVRGVLPERSRFAFVLGFGMIHVQHGRKCYCQNMKLS